MASNWKEYQEEAAQFFRNLGLDAQTDVTVQGVRTKHAIDVLVRSHHLGFDVTWIVECKYWATSVTKVHVLALREIVSDLGADRGILLAENGYQSGAIEAANLTNVHLTSLLEAQKHASADITAMRLRELHDRIEICREQYWDIPKEKRIESGLRQEVGLPGYSAFHVFHLIDDVLPKALRGAFPIEAKFGASLAALNGHGFPPQISSAEQLVEALSPMISDLERRLNFVVSSLRN